MQKHPVIREVWKMLSTTFLSWRSTIPVSVVKPLKSPTMKKSNFNALGSDFCDYRSLFPIFCFLFLFFCEYALIELEQFLSRVFYCSVLIAKPEPPPPGLR